MWRHKERVLLEDQTGREHESTRRHRRYTMGRPKTKTGRDAQRRNLRMPPDVWGRLDAAARKLKTSTPELLLMLVEDFLSASREA